MHEDTLTNARIRSMLLVVILMGVSMLLVSYRMTHSRGSGLKLKRGTGKPDWSPQSPVNITWVDGTGDVTKRLLSYNAKISSVRAAILKTRSGSWWRGAKVQPQSGLYGLQPDFLHLLGALPKVTVIGLRWMKSGVEHRIKGALRVNPENLIINSYYDWVADSNLCAFLTTTGQSYPQWAFWPSCTTKLGATLFPKPIDGRFVNIRWWAVSRTSPKKVPYSLYSEEPEFITYIIIAEDGTITPEGSLITGDVQIIPFTCKAHLANPLDFSSSTMFEEVFVISQIWLYEYYHKSIEMYPRLAPYLPFLIRNPRIRIHAGKSKDIGSEWLNLFQLPRYRFIKGTVRANIVYLPEVTYCGFANPLQTQLISKMYRGKIRQYSPNLKLDTVILIRRTHSRGIKQHRELKYYLRDLAFKHHWQFKEFSDNPVPSLQESMLLFNRAVLVVGPHGAGLSNIIFSEPGIFIIEILCHVPEVNMCYQRLSYVLGHHYYGTAAKSGCSSELDIELEALIEVTEFYARQAVKLSESSKNFKRNEIKIINA